MRLAGDDGGWVVVWLSGCVVELSVLAMMMLVLLVLLVVLAGDQPAHNKLKNNIWHLLFFFQNAFFTFFLFFAFCFFSEKMSDLDIIFYWFQISFYFDFFKYFFHLAIISQQYILNHFEPRPLQRHQHHQRPLITAVFVFKLMMKMKRKLAILNMRLPVVLILIMRKIKMMMQTNNNHTRTRTRNQQPATANNSGSRLALKGCIAGGV